jgi:nitrogen fixation protein NifB
MLAAAKARRFVTRWGPDAVVGVAGPGEPLANEETFTTLSLIRRDFPDISLCVCTNGLNLLDRFEDLIGLNVRFLTVTVNGIDPAVVARIQPEVRIGNRVITGHEGARILIDRQLLGLRRAVAAGMWVKVNCVVIPEVNGGRVVETAFAIADLGVHVFNPIPLIPRARFAHLKPPDDRDMRKLMSACAEALPVFHQCKRCRADAEGIPGKERSQ